MCAGPGFAGPGGAGPGGEGPGGAGPGSTQVQGQRRSKVKAGPWSTQGQVNAGLGQRRSGSTQVQGQHRSRSTQVQRHFSSRPFCSRFPLCVRGISVLPFHDDTARVRIGSSSWRATSKRRYGAPSCVTSAHRPSEAHSVGGQGTNETTEADTKFSGTTGSHATRRAMAAARKRVEKLEAVLIT